MSLLNALTGPNAQVIVGWENDTQEFSIHKKLLCDSSTYFKAALTNGFAETHDQGITLDDESPVIFRTYALWLYEQRLNRDTMPSGDRSAEGHLLELYVFADKRGIPDLANDTITMLASRWAVEPVDLNNIGWLFSFVSRSSKLYQLIVDKLVLEFRNDSEELESRLVNGDLPSIALVDLLFRSHSITENFNESQECFESACHYHLHGQQGGMSEEDCIRRIEDGINVWDDDIDREQHTWDWD